MLLSHNIPIPLFDVYVITVFYQNALMTQIVLDKLPSVPETRHVLVGPIFFSS